MRTNLRGRKKPYHKAAFVGVDGKVSALCFRRPRAINLGQALWTNRDEAVTCRKCLRIMRPIRTEVRCSRAACRIPTPPP